MSKAITTTEPPLTRKIVADIVGEVVGEIMNDVLKLIDGRFKQIEKRLDAMDKRFEVITATLAKHDQKFDEITTILTRHDKKFEEIAADIKVIKREQTTQREWIGEHEVGIRQLKKQVA